MARRESVSPVRTKPDSTDSQAISRGAFGAEFLLGKSERAPYNGAGPLFDPIYGIGQGNPAGPRSRGIGRFGHGGKDPHQSTPEQ